MSNTVSVKDIFRILPEEARYIYKDKDGYVFWAVDEPDYVKNDDKWYASITSVGGYLGNINVEEFEGLDWKYCLYEKDKGNLFAKNSSEKDVLKMITKIKEFETLNIRIKELENTVKTLVSEISDLKYKQSNPWTTINKYPTITYFNNEEK